MKPVITPLDECRIGRWCGDSVVNVLGDMPLRKLQNRVDLLDQMYA